MPNQENVSLPEFERLLILHAIIQNKFALLYMLLVSGSDVNFYDNGETPLHLTVCGNNIAMVMLLLECGANIDLRNSAGRTALHLAVLSDDINAKNIVELLLDKGADVNLGDSEKLTALHLAVVHKDSEMIKLLLDKGADVNLGDIGGVTALDYAIVKKDREKITLLLVKCPNLADIRVVHTLGLMISTDNIDSAKLMIDLLLLRFQLKEKPTRLKNHKDLSDHWDDRQLKIDYLIENNSFGKNNNTQKALSSYGKKDSLKALALTMFFDSLSLEQIKNKNSCDADKSIEAPISKLG